MKPTKASLDSLEQAVNQYDESLTRIQSWRNIKDNVVYISALGLRHGSGLMITEDGYILTAAHVPDNLFTKGPCYTGRHDRQEKHAISPEILIKDDAKDIALIKADTGAAPSPIPFHIETGLYPLLMRRERMYVHAYLGRIPLTLSGSMNSISINLESEEGTAIMKNAFSFFSPTRPGNSGGAVVTDGGKYAGCVIRRGKAEHNQSLTYAARAQDIRDMVLEYVKSNR